MKIIRKVSQKEMDRKFPDLILALRTDPSECCYCNNCDGLRVFKDNKCTSCGKC